MLKLDRIMQIATEHAPHCCGQGDVGAERHNIMVLSVAIQEALSENDEKIRVSRGFTECGGGKADGAGGIQKGSLQPEETACGSKVEVRRENVSP